MSTTTGGGAYFLPLSPVLFMSRMVAIVKVTLSPLRSSFSAYTGEASQGGQRLFGGLARNAEESGQRSVLRLGELCQAMLDVSLGRTANLPGWLLDTASIQKVVYAHSEPYALILYGHYLLLEGRSIELHELTEQSTRQANTMKYLLPRLYHSLYPAAAEYQEGEKKQAVLHLNEALELALPDRIYLPFACFSPHLEPLFSMLDQEGSKQAALEALRAVCAPREGGGRGSARGPA